MSEIVKVLESALQRERYIADLFSMLHTTLDRRERRRILDKIEHFRQQRHALFNAWLQHELHQDELAGPVRHIPSGAVFDAVIACVEPGAMDPVQPTMEYWLCCGSQDRSVHSSGCITNQTGMPVHCRFGTADEHSKWSLGNRITK